ncbi:AAA family ATPase [Halobacteria archaeon AArc-m2/3/4]|uniref:AAA family ATPase n=1 Tax=Natronoglomus mannanivorans TaxID=2979990 RepID=A0ABT2QC64_9EURY|nr:AAA family ATPase [Halobacteria archaeon AArc-m2/3/4]
MIVVICGPAGVGKTTTVSRVRRRLTTRGRDIRVSRSDDFSRNTYEQLYANVAVEPESARTDDNTLHLVDGTFYKSKWQRAFRTLEDVRFVLITASLETCLERNRRRSDPIDEQGVYVVYHEFAEPDADLVVDTDELPVEAAVDRVVCTIEAWWPLRSCEASAE